MVNFLKLTKRKLLFFTLKQKHKSAFVRKQIKFKCEKHGSNYGGWVIKRGSVQTDSIIYSFGVGEDITFDLSLIDKYGCIVHAFDPTPKSIEWITSQETPNKLKFYDYGISDFDGAQKFFPPENPEFVSHSIFELGDKTPIEFRVKKLDSIMSFLNHNHISVLKMDIEGSEYSVIDYICQNNVSVDQILVEFHHRFDNVGFEKTIDSILKLNEAGFKIFYISASGEEFSFWREVK